MFSLSILVLSGIALIRFAVSQWRAIWISSASQPVSDSLQLSAGIDAAAIGAGDFGRLMNLCDQLSPELKQSSPWLNEVSEPCNEPRPAAGCPRELNPKVLHFSDLTHICIPLMPG
jgi:hypothetical protein